MSARARVRSREQRAGHKLRVPCVVHDNAMKSQRVDLRAPNAVCIFIPFVFFPLFSEERSLAAWERTDAIFALALSPAGKIDERKWIGSGAIRKSIGRESSREAR